MSGPRIIFTRFESALSPRLHTWRAHRALVLGGSVPDEALTEADVAIVWHLASSNNRELARGARLHSEFTAAVADAETAVAAAAASAVMLVSDERRGRYGWHLDTEDGPLVVCSRWYEADRERRHSVAIARLGLGASTIATGARQLIDSGARRGGRDDD